MMQKLLNSTSLGLMLAVLSQPIFGPEISAIKLSKSVPVGSNLELSYTHSRSREVLPSVSIKKPDTGLPDHLSGLSKRSPSSPVTAARRVEPRFEENSVNNTLVTANIGESVALHCRIWMKQSATVSWSVNRGSSMDLLTVGNTTFSGDQRYSVVFQNPTNWALVIERVQASDAGKYICTLETFPKQSLIIFLQVNGPVLEILNSSSGLVYSTGSYLSMECLYLNQSRAPTPTTTPHPLFPVDQKIPLPTDVLRWTMNNRTFSLRNRKRVHAYWTGHSVVSILSIKSAIIEDTGNYSCILPATGERVTVMLNILKGEHSSELRPDNLLASLAQSWKLKSSLKTSLLCFWWILELLVR